MASLSFENHTALPNDMLIVDSRFLPSKIQRTKGKIPQVINKGSMVIQKFPIWPSMPIECFHADDFHATFLNRFGVSVSFLEKSIYCVQYWWNRFQTNFIKRVFHDKEIWCISVRLSDRSKVTQHKINFVKNCPQWGLNPQPPDNQSNALLTVLGKNLLKISEASFLFFHAPLHLLGLCLFLESIEHDFIKALMIHTHNQIVT